MLPKKSARRYDRKIAIARKWLLKTVRPAYALYCRINGWRRHSRRSRQFRMTHLAMDSLPDNRRFRHMNFTFAMIALAAKMAKIDGAVKEEEFLAFYQGFPMPAGEYDKIRQLFMMAAEDTTDAEIYARRIASLFPGRRHRSLLKNLLWRLIDIAKVDGEMNRLELDFLHSTTEIFGIKSRAVSRRLYECHAAPIINPYTLLQVKPEWSDQQIRHAYLRLIRHSHPDKVQANGGTKEAVRIASHHMALLNAAYTHICQERNVKSANNF